MSSYSNMLRPCAHHTTPHHTTHHRTHGHEQPRSSPEAHKRGACTYSGGITGTRGALCTLARMMQLKDLGGYRSHMPDKVQNALHFAMVAAAVVCVCARACACICVCVCVGGCACVCVYVCVCLCARHDIPTTERVGHRGTVWADVLPRVVVDELVHSYLRGACIDHKGEPQTTANHRNRINYESSKTFLCFRSHFQYSKTGAGRHGLPHDILRSRISSAVVTPVPRPGTHAHGITEVMKSVEYCKGGVANAWLRASGIVRHCQGSGRS